MPLAVYKKKKKCHSNSFIAFLYNFSTIFVSCYHDIYNTDFSHCGSTETSNDLQLNLVSKLPCKICSNHFISDLEILYNHVYHLRADEIVQIISTEQKQVEVERRKKHWERENRNLSGRQVEITRILLDLIRIHIFYHISYMSDIISVIWLIMTWAIPLWV